MRRCPGPGISDEDKAEVERFANFLRDPDPDRAAAYRRHYPEDTKPNPLRAESD